MPSPRIRVVVISDQENSRLILATSQVQVVSCVKNISEVVNAAHKKAEIDCFLLESDFLDGSRATAIESIRTLKSAFPEIPVLILSPRSDEVFIAETVHAGASGYIIKKDICKEIEEAFSKAMAGDIYLSPWVPRSMAKALQKQANTLRRLQKEDCPKLSELTDRQKEILKLLAQGYTNKQIADNLKLSVKTVDVHRANLMNRLQVNGLPGLIKYALRTGLISLD